MVKTTAQLRPVQREPVMQLAAPPRQGRRRRQLRRQTPVLEKVAAVTPGRSATAATSRSRSAPAATTATVEAAEAATPSGGRAVPALTGALARITLRAEPTRGGTPTPRPRYAALPIVISKPKQAQPPARQAELPRLQERRQPLAEQLMLAIPPEPEAMETTQVPETPDTELPLVTLSQASTPEWARTPPSRRHLEADLDFWTWATN